MHMRTGHSSVAAIIMCALKYEGCTALVWGRRVPTRGHPVLGIIFVGRRKQQSPRRSRLLTRLNLRFAVAGVAPVTLQSSHINEQRGAGFMER